MSIQLITLLKIIGWVLTIAPLAGFVLFAVIMVKEISKNDDESLKGIINLGFLIFGIGVVLLLVSYLSGYFSQASGTI